MNDMKIVDMHCDTLLQLRMTGRRFEDFGGHISMEKLRRGGALLQCFAVFTPTGPEAKIYRLSESAWDFFNKAADIFDEQIKLCASDIAPMCSMADFEKNLSEGKVSAMLTLEDAICLEGDISRVQKLYDRGVRLVTLTWNYENSLAYPHSEDESLHRKGLKDFGFEVIDAMARLGMVADVSHLSEGGFYDVARANTKPFVASHSCCRALSDHSRSLTDKQLHTLGDLGCVCGINFYSDFLCRGSEYSRNEDILRHMEYAVNHAGIEAVALGSDFDGIHCALEMQDYSGMAKLSELIAARFGYDDAEKILSKNALRVFREVIG